jgi:hypothetical protein
MLLVRIKLKNRSEYRKLIVSNKNNFKYKDFSYTIDPHCVYHTCIYGFLNVRCIDFIEGQTDPVDYYNILDNVTLRKQKDTINSLVKGWFSNKILKLVDYILIGLSVSGISGIISVILLFLIGQYIGVW